MIKREIKIMDILPSNFMNEENTGHFQIWSKNKFAQFHNYDDNNMYKKEKECKRALKYKQLLMNILCPNNKGILNKT